MEDRRDYRVQVLVVAVTAWLVVGGVPTSAQLPGEDPFRWEPTITVNTNTDAVVVDSQVRGSVPGGSAIQASGSGSNCALQATNIGSSLSEEFWDRPPNELPFFLWCNGELVGLVWRVIGIGGGVSGPVLSPQEIAMRLRDRIPIPKVMIGVNPDRGLVGVESWFWIEGYDGGPVSESTEAFGQGIEVQAHVERYEWFFGDDSTLSTKTLGRSYPERSDVRHIYERSSLGYEKGYPVEVGFFFSVRYRVDGGGWIELPGIERFAEASYQVRESQAVIKR
jgi:hypothetical protein